MALKVIQRIQLLGQTGAHLCAPGRLGRISRLLSAPVGELLCVACLWTSAESCIQRHRCQRLSKPACGRMSLSTIAKDAFYTTGSVGLHKDSVPRFRLSQLHRPTVAEEKAFLDRLSSCSSSRQVLRLLRTVEIMSDTMAAAALHRVADLEQDGTSLKDPSVLEKDPLSALCCQLEQDSGRLTEAGLVSTLLACTRLYVDPWSTLVVRLVSESQERLDRGQMSIGQLCTLGQALLALEGPGCGMLEQVMEQVQKQEPGQWSLAELTAVYGLLQAGVGEEGSYQDLLNAMHTHAVSVTSHMDPPAVSGVFSALVVLNQTQAMPLVISLCKQAVRHVPHFKDEELGLVLGALMHFGHSDHFLVKAMERHVPKMAFTSHPETVTKVMEYFGRRNILSLPVFDAVAESFVYRADDYSTGQVARQITPFGKLGYLPPNAGEVFRKVEAILRARFSHFQPRTLLNLLHSCILVERFPVNFVSKGPRLLPKYHVKSFLTPGRSLETPVDGHLYNYVKTGLVDLLGARAYFASRVLTPYCYTLVCIDGHKRFTVNTRQLLGKEAIKQRHLRLLGYEVVQIPYYEFEKLRNKTEVVEYLHKKIFPLSYRLSW
ncbi:unnamed protein product [Coregonus sp. 'balchen']|nr:unnamed protein product [Coregonus sp. 'balchen']